MKVQIAVRIGFFPMTSQVIRSRGRMFSEGSVRKRTLSTSTLIGKTEGLVKVAFRILATVDFFFETMRTSPEISTFSRVQSTSQVLRPRGRMFPEGSVRKRTLSTSTLIGKTEGLVKVAFRILATVDFFFETMRTSPEISTFSRVQSTSQVICDR